MTPVDLSQSANSREKILFILVLLVLLVLYFRVVFSSQKDAINQLQSQREALSLEKEALKKFMETTPTVARSTTLLQKKGTKAKIILGEVKPSYGAISQVLEQITQVEFLSGVSVKGIHYEPLQGEKGYSHLDFNLHLQGGFADLMKYLGRLEQFPALINLEQIQFSVLPYPSEDLEVQIQGRFFQIERVESRS